MKVLIVDDEPLELLNLQTLLQKASQPIEILIADNGLDAIILLEKVPVDLVFLDIRMPGRDGLEVLEIIHHRWPTTEVAMISAYGEFQFAKKALDLGASAYLLKPFRTAEFYETLDKLIQRHTARYATVPIIRQSLIEKVLLSGATLEVDLWTSHIGFIPNVVFVVEIMENQLVHILQSEIKTEWGIWAPEKVSNYYVLLSREEYLEEIQHLLMGLRIQDSKLVFAIGISRTLDLSNAFHQALQQVREGHHRMVDRCLAFIRENFDKMITLADVASSIHISPSHLNRLLKKELGTTFVEILVTARIERAKELLRKSYSIDYVASVTGFNSTTYFTVTFKKMTGQSPSSYRRERN
ncbi:response regulator [Ammoniphilus sp. CFH 90114]|uniref:response regulator n=1 Tax=Ammoniphilus sp. CFH 90114 TaxID=2493665 RepID=UPI0013E938DC|nr:response regulator [Ammoniphilus sp. CFH 90114]